MKVEIEIHSITIKDENTGEVKTINTLRNVDDIAGYIEESEKDEISYRVERQVIDAINK